MSKAVLAVISSAVIVGSSLIVAIASPPASGATRPAGGDLSGIGIQKGGPKVESNVILYDRARKSPDWTSTPDGMAYASCVHQILPGEKLDSVNDTITNASGAVVQKFAACQYPRLVDPHAASPSASLHPAASRSTVSHAASPGAVPGTTTWLGAVWDDPGTWVSYLSVSYAVPYAPTVTGSTDYIFSSLENSGGDTILQPVVGYGPTAASGKPSTTNIGGNYLWMAPYYVWGGGNNVAVGSLYRVYDLDTISGIISSGSCKSGGAGCTWTVSIEDENTGQLSELTVGSDPSFTEVQGGVLESTTSTYCTELFANGHGVFRKLAFYNGSGGQITPAWYVGNQVNTCKMHMDWSNTAVDILYSA